MAAPTLIEIENGYFGLSLVDPEAIGWTDAWQSPAGDTGDGLGTVNAELEDYTATPDGWRCQVTLASVTTSPSTTTTTVKATFCEPSSELPTPGQSGYGLNLEWYQDFTKLNSLSLWLFEHDVERAYAYLGFNGDEAPKVVGVVRLAPGDIGGAARSPLEASVTLQFIRKPLIMPVTETITPTGVTPGEPGAFTPLGATPPANLAALMGLGALGQTTAWEEGEYVVLGDLSHAYWDGDSWEAGEAPA